MINIADRYRGVVGNAPPIRLNMREHGDRGQICEARPKGRRG